MRSATARFKKVQKQQRTPLGQLILRCPRNAFGCSWADSAEIWFTQTYTPETRYMTTLQKSSLYHHHHASSPSSSSSFIKPRGSKYKTAELSQRRPRDAPNIWVPWEVLRVLTTHPATFPEICNGLLFRSILRMCVQNLKFVALPIPEIIGGTQKIGQSLYTPTLHFLPNF